MAYQPPYAGIGSEESEMLMWGSPAPELAVFASSAARRLEAQGDASDVSGLRTASGCGSVRDDVSTASHRAATTAAHIHCAVVLLRELGVSQPQSLRWGHGGSRKAMVEPYLYTRDWGAFLLDWICPSPPPSSHRPAGSPGDRAYTVLCAPLSLLEWGPGSESLFMLSLCQLGMPTMASLTTPSSHCPESLEDQAITTLFSFHQHTGAELQLLRKAGTIRTFPLGFGFGPLSLLAAGSGYRALASVSAVDHTRATHSPRWRT